MLGKQFSRRLLIATVLALALASVAAIAALGGSRDITQPTVIKTMEVGGFGKTIDLGTVGNSVGDEGVIYHKLYDHSGAHKLGFVTVICFTVFPRTSTFECYSTMHLRGGSVGVAGTYFGTHRVNRWSVTGGTGRFQNARGWMYIAPAPNGLLFHDLHLIP